MVALVIHTRVIQVQVTRVAQALVLVQEVLVIKLNGTISLNITHTLNRKAAIELITGNSGITLSHSDLMEALEERFALKLEECAKDLVEEITAKTDAESITVDYDIE